MSRALWLNPAVGVSGDMLLGALIDVGAGEATVRQALEALDVPGWDLEIVEVDRRGLRCQHAVVHATAAESRNWSSIDALISAADLPAAVAAGARTTFRKLAEAEARRHGVDIDAVHFHEVGAVDAIVDIVGCWAALDALDVWTVQSGPVGLGVGTVSSSHGVLPHPVPAVLELLVGVPVVGVESAAETATPTGAALLITMVDDWGPVPAGRLAGSGMGAGTRDPEGYPNVLGAVTIDADDFSVADAVLIETNIDDVTPEILGRVVERALQEGADDAWIVPVVMKKTRPGHELRILCAPGLVSRLVDLVAAETGTLGMRTSDVTKHIFPRRFDEVAVAGEVIRVKVGIYGAKPEAADVDRIANATGRSARSVAAEALSEWMRSEAEGEEN